MGQPVILPKFELPGDKPHWAVRLAWGTGAVLLASMLGLGAVIVHHRNLESQIEAAKADAIAKADAEAARAVEAKRKLADAAAAERAARQAEVAARQAARTVTANTVANIAGKTDSRSDTATGAATAAVDSKPVKVNTRRHAHSGGTARGAKTVKVATSDGASISDKSSSSKSATKKNDVIDDLLAKMK